VKERGLGPRRGECVAVLVRRLAQSAEVEPTSPPLGVVRLRDCRAYATAAAWDDFGNAGQRGGSWSWFITSTTINAPNRAICARLPSTSHRLSCAPNRRSVSMWACWQAVAELTRRAEAFMPRFGLGGVASRGTGLSERRTQAAAGPGSCRLALEEAVVKAQGVVERVHLVVVEHADPVAQLSDVDAEHLLEEYAALPAR
jgi:hypothetical protein